MAMTNKIKVHDIAKSFNLPSKDIMNILSEYSTPPKSHSAVMTEEEISIVLDYLTQKNQISSIEVIFADSFQAGGVRYLYEQHPVLRCLHVGSQFLQSIIFGTKNRDDLAEILRLDQI